MLGRFVAVLFQVLHEWRPASSDGMRVLRIRLSLPENVGRSVFKVQRTEGLESFHARIEHRSQRSMAGTLDK